MPGLLKDFEMWLVKLEFYRSHYQPYSDRQLLQFLFLLLISVGACVPKTGTSDKAPFIKSLQPYKGPRGTSVTIAGERLCSSGQIFFGSEPVDIIYESPTRVRFIVPKKTNLVSASVRIRCDSKNSNKAAFTIIVERPEIRNEPPSVGKVLLDGSPVREYSIVTAEVSDINDPNGDTVQLSYAWFVNGTLTSASGASIDGQFFDKGDSLQVQVSPTDGFDAGEPVLSNSVSVINSLPTPPRIRMYPELPTNTENLSLQIASEAVDPDNDQLDYSIRWYENGSELGYFSDFTEVPNASLSLGAIYKVVVSVSDDGFANEVTTWSLRAITNSTWRSIGLGANFSCGIRGDRSLWCWGMNNFRQLGAGSTSAFSATPLRVGSSFDWDTVSSSYSHSCARKVDRTLWCWGYNDNGELGLGWSSLYEPSPSQVTTASVSHWVSHSASCGINEALELWCWGSNKYGQLGVTSIGGEADAPLQVTSTSDWTSVVKGAGFVCARTITSEAYCWGRNDYFSALGLGLDDYAVSSPIQLSGDWELISLGDDHGCGISFWGRLFCWGLSSSTQTGTGATGFQNLPAEVINRRQDWLSVAAGGEHSCGLISSGSLYCWGSNDFGQLGTGSFVGIGSPIESANGLYFVSIYAGRYHSCGIDIFGKLFCWGSNDEGELGNGTTTDSHSPVLVLIP